MIGNLRGGIVARKLNNSMPLVISGYLYTNDPETTGTRLTDPAWPAWLETASAFYYEAWTDGSFSARSQKAHDQDGTPGAYWYAYKRVKGKLLKRYLGTGRALTRERLDAVAAQFAALAAGRPGQGSS